jgi:hypothetical protein
MKKYTMWRVDDTEWVLEVDDEKLGEWLKKSNLKIERFAVGINVPLRVFKVLDEDVEEVESQIDKYLKRRKDA